MSSVAPVSPFSYRLPRFPIAFPFPVLFCFGSHRVGGQCLNLSCTGLFAEFGTPVAVEAVGVVHLQPAGYVLEVLSSVVHSEGFRAGLLFAFQNREQEQLLRALVKAIGTRSLLRADESI